MPGKVREWAAIGQLFGYIESVEPWIVDNDEW